MSPLIAWIEDFRTENPDRRFMRNDMSDHDWNMLFLARLAVDRFKTCRAEDKAHKQIALAGDFMFDNATHVMGGSGPLGLLRMQSRTAPIGPVPPPRLPSCFSTVVAADRTATLLSLIGINAAQPDFDDPRLRETGSLSSDTHRDNQ